MGLARAALLWASKNRWLADRFPRYRFVQRSVRRFMPGERLEDAIEAARGFQGTGIDTLFTHLGEHVGDLDEAAAVADHYLQAVKQIEEAGLSTEVSVKLTHLGLDLDVDSARAHADALAAAAAGQQRRFWIDMESSPYVDRTLDVYRLVQERHGNVGVCLQAYLYRSPADLRALQPLEPAIRLVKGAYREPPSVAYPRKRDVDSAFLGMSRMLLDATESGVVAGFATHDVDLLSTILGEARERGVPGDAYEIQMLYGIKTADQHRLAAEGHRVYDLISYGSGWFPWYLRRLAERPANVGFVLRNLFARSAP